eukprot:2269851-Pyramimonas_sp.AAC.1
MLRRGESEAPGGSASVAHAGHGHERLHLGGSGPAPHWCSPAWMAGRRDGVVARGANPVVFVQGETIGGTAPTPPTPLPPPAIDPIGSENEYCPFEFD